MALTVTWLGHSTVVIDVDGVRLVTDPLLQPHNGPLRRRADQPTVAAWAGAHAVLLSHLHHDHCELSSLRMLSGVPVLTAPRSADWLRRKGIGSALGLGEDAWREVADSVEVRLTRADHHSRPMPHRPNDANGHLVRSPTATVYVAGDTSIHDEMAGLADLLGRPVDVAILPIWGWGSRLSPGHMDGHQAAEAAALIGARAAIAVHWGTLHVPLLRDSPRGWMDRPHTTFVEALTHEAPDCELIDLRPGESWSSITE